MVRIKNFKVKSINKMDKELCKFMKVCKECGELKLMIKFGKDKGHKDGRINQCYKCRNNRHKKYNHICEYCGKEFVGTKNQRFHTECKHKWLGERQQKENHPNWKGGKVLVNCDNCGQPISIDQYRLEYSEHHFCNSKCKGDWYSKNLKGENNHNWDRVKVNCDYCGDLILVTKYKLQQKYHFCSKECQHKWRSENIRGENHPLYNSVLTPCDCCGDLILVPKYKLDFNEHHFCSKECQHKWLGEYYRGENHPNWKGGITQINDYLREHINSWRNDSMKYCNYKSDISGQYYDIIIHHINKNFSEIVKETLAILNLEPKQINEYTLEELNNITETCEKLHYKYGLGICITKEEHILFHKIYGRENNTKQQYEEFKTKYLNGEFKKAS